MARPESPLDNPFAPDVRLSSDDDFAKTLELLEEAKSESLDAWTASLLDDSISFLKSLPTASCQVLMHSVFRQVGANVKMASDFGAGKSVEPKDLLKGFGSRLSGNMLSLTPASAIAQFVKNKGASPQVQAIASAVVDTVAGVAIELKSMSARIKVASGVDVSSMKSAAFKRAYCTAFIPTLCRNFLEWESSFIDVGDDTGNKYEDCARRFASGAAFGFLTVFPDTIANLALLEGAKASGSSIVESIAKAAGNVGRIIAADPTKFVMESVKSSPARMIPVGIASVIFSDDGFKAISDMLDEITATIDVEAKDSFLRHFFEELELLGVELSLLETDHASNVGPFLEKVRSKYLAEHGVDLESERDAAIEDYPVLAAPSVKFSAPFLGRTLGTQAQRPKVTPGSGVSKADESRRTFTTEEFAGNFLKHFEGEMLGGGAGGGGRF